MKTIQMPVNKDYQILFTDVEKYGCKTYYMTYIDDDQENMLNNGRNIYIKRDKISFVVEQKDVICYGDVDFSNGSDDMQAMKAFPYLKDSSRRGVALYSDYDYDSHTCHTVDGIKGLRYYETWDFSKVAKYHYAALGKPSKILMFVKYAVG